jgi:hypothetical protein
MMPHTNRRTCPAQVWALAGDDYLRLQIFNALPIRRDRRRIKRLRPWWLRKLLRDLTRDSLECRR